MRTNAGTDARTRYRSAATLLLLFASAFSASAQYCSPTVNTTGLYLSNLNFHYSTQMTNGQDYTTGSSGYSQTIATPAGTIKRYWGASIGYNIQNNSATSKAYCIKIFADWNNDGDFNDNLEDNASNSSIVNANANTGTSITIIPPLYTSGTVRVRVALAEGTTYPTACGSFTGEVEDYELTIADNEAPVLSTTTSPVLNNLLVGQTNSEGFTINQFLASAGLTAELATDGNDNGNSKIPRGLAIYGQSATNGIWQYRVGAGAWQAFGSLSSANALLLIGDGSSSRFQPGVRIRFVPTGTGTASFSYALWDGTSADNGSRAAITATGGSSAISTAVGNASLSVASTVANGLQIFLSTTDGAVYGTQLNATTAFSAEPTNSFGTGDNFYSNDIALDATNTKAYWISGADGTRIASANTDGTGLQTALVSNLLFGVGLAVSPDKLFFTDYSPGVYSTNPDGSGLTSLTGGLGQLDPMDIGDIGDIEYASNKLYFICASPDLSTYSIKSANTDGTGVTDEYSTSSYIKGLAVSGTHIYWTELDEASSPKTFSVVRKSLLNGTVTTLTTVATDRVFNDLVADEINGNVYVVVSDNNSTGTSELRRLPIAGGTLTTVLSLSGNVSSLAYNAPSKTLPVRLVKFEALLQANGTGLLRWVTGTEQQSSHFVIDKSSDGRNFSPAATVAATGATGGASYSWTDTKLQPGNNYYRLSEVSLDGKKQDLGIRRLEVVSHGHLQVYPNPASGGSITVNTGHPLPAALDYRLLDAGGRTVRSGTITQQQQPLTFGQLARGQYLLVLSDGQHLQLTIN